MIRTLFVFLAAIAAAAEIRFEDVTARSGVDFTLRNGASGRHRQVELMPGGAAAADFDNDGCMDLYFTNGAALPALRKTGPPYHNRLYLGHCDFTFTDITADAGAAGQGYSMGVAAADFDNDGYTDLYVAGVNANTLYRNRSAGGGPVRFENLTVAANAAAVDERRGKLWSVSPGWIDYDNDGRLDLFIANYLAWDPRTESRCGLPAHPLYCHPDNYRGLPNQLLRNNGGGTFADVSAATGIAAEIGKGMGTAFADFDGDGFTDIYVANDSMRGFLFRNQAGKGFVETGLEAGVALRADGAAIAGMGVDFRDLDDDGWPDLAVTGMLNDSYLLFRNLGKDALFEDIGGTSGVAVLTRQLTGWGAGIQDFDNDGHKDLFFANAHFPQLDRYTGVDSALPNMLLRNQGGGRFLDVSQTSGLGAAKALHRGAVFADFDNDGRLDIVVTAIGSQARIWRNATSESGNWIAFRLRGAASNRDGLGARVAVSAAGRTFHNHATTSVGYASSSERLVRFGLGAAAKADRVEIRWPSGIVQSLEDLEANRIADVSEPGR